MSSIRLLPVKNTYATGTLTLTGVGVAAETVTVGSTVYTWRAAVGATANEVLIGADAAACVTNLVAAINATAASAGTLFGSATVANPAVTAADGAGDTVVVTATDAYEGPVGVTVATTETMTNASWAATTLTAAGATSSAAPTITNGALGMERPFLTDEAVLHIRSLRGSGTMTIVGGRLWGWSPEEARWCNIGPINGGTDIAELSADYIDYTELVVGLRPFSRFYLAFTSLGGTATEIEARLHCTPAAFATT